MLPNYSISLTRRVVVVLWLLVRIVVRIPNWTPNRNANRIPNRMAGPDRRKPDPWDTRSAG